MAAVLAVALLLLCGNVQSVPDVTEATVTQVKEIPFSNTAGDNSLAMAPAITTPTEGSGVTRSAVLSSKTLEQDDSVVMVDLARSDDEKLVNVTSGASPPSSDESSFSGFDLKEEEPEFAVLGSDSSDPDFAEPRGILKDDGDFPTIGDVRDLSYNGDYGIHNEGSSGTLEYGSESLSSHGQDVGSDYPDFAEPRGILKDDGDFPTIGDVRDLSYNGAFRVRNEESSGTLEYEYESYSSHVPDVGSGEYDSDSLYEPPQGGFLTNMPNMDLNP